ncbi:MAG: AgmX/PglI C-terminal domain-containing protein [bacterium]
MGWALLESPAPAPGRAAPVSAAVAPTPPPPPPLPPLPDRPASDAPPPPRPFTVTTAIQPPPPAVLAPPIPTDRAGVRRLIAQEAPQVPGVGDPTNPDEPPGERAPGTMRKEAVQAAIGTARPAIADCYRQALAQTADLEGVLKVSFTVQAEGGKGHMKDAEIIEDTLGNPFLGMCALRAIAELSFEAEMDGEVKVNYPFILRPTPDEPAEEE